MHMHMHNYKIPQRGYAPSPNVPKLSVSGLKDTAKSYKE